MQTVLMIAIAIHVLPAVFWAGSTFVLARSAGRGSDRLFGAQMGAGTVTILAGAYLWGAAHAGVFGRKEMFLAVGAICALIAFAVQAIMVGGSLARLRKNAEDAAANARIGVAQRVSALLLGVATIAMATSKYA